jgi:short-subunit dehydrogenase
MDGLRRSLATGCILCLLAGCASRSGRVQTVEGNPLRTDRRLEGKTYVITGASSGFGRGTALKLGASGANVVLAARRTAVLEEVAGKVHELGGTPLVITTDVASASDMARLARASVARFGRIDVWINNAGVGVVAPFWKAPVRDYSRLVDVNLKGVIYGSHVALRQFLAQGEGTLVNIGSVDSEVPLAYQAAYSATKAGVLGLGRALNEDLRLAGARRIKVATVMPWAADTPWWPHAANYSGTQPRMASMDDAWKVVEVIVRAGEHPREEMPAGWKARASYLSHRLFPDFTESFSGDVADREMRKASPAAPTASSLYQPIPTGRTVAGGVRARMDQEDAAR